jgi:hypothetical protein
MALLIWRTFYNGLELSQAGIQQIVRLLWRGFSDFDKQAHFSKDDAKQQLGINKRGVIIVAYYPNGLAFLKFNSGSFSRSSCFIFIV